VHNYNNFSLNSTISGLSGMNTSSYSDISSSTLTTFQQQQSAGVVKFTKVIQFNPQGEASIGANSAQCVQIGLQPEYGNNTNNSNVAVFQIETLTGQVQVFRK
jgi:2-keto-3-deoxy-L-rhamnonate aldolase RhmA